MQEITDYRFYNIDDLIQLWREGGWKALAKLGDALCPPSGDGSAVYSDCPTKRVRYGIRELFDSLVMPLRPDHIEQPHLGYSELELLGLAAAPDGKYSLFSPSKYLPRDGDSGGSAKDDAELRKILRRITKAFVTSETLGEVLGKISNPENYKRFTKDFIKYNYEKELEKYLATKITPVFKSMMKSLSDGLRSRYAGEEAWWNYVIFILEPLTQTLLEIKRHIDADTPLREDQISMLNHFLDYGRVFGARVSYDDGRETYDVALRPQFHRLGTCSLTVVSALLAQPAFVLAAQLRNKCSKPRFVKQCRAPSCGRLFYTGYKNAVVCKGTEGGKKSKCALEWVRYNRYLVKTRKKPEEDWNNQKLREEFLSYDKD